MNESQSTAKKDGHGYGLHRGTLAAKGMGGSLTVLTDGRGKGASFALELPFDQERRLKGNGA